MIFLLLLSELLALHHPVIIKIFNLEFL